MYWWVALSTVDSNHLLLCLLICSVFVLFTAICLSVCHLTLFADLSIIFLVAVPPTIVSHADPEIAYRVREPVDIPCVASGDPPPT